MIEGLWFAIVGFSCLVALTNWRTGIYLAIALDCLRDPVRKLTDDQSVLITLAGIVVWAPVILRAYQEQQGELRTIFRRYPRLRTMVTCLCMAIFPAAALSAVLYPGGWMLAAIGGVSYLAPVLGIGLGYLVPRSENDVYRLLRFYTVVNSAVLIGTPLEYLKFDLPGIGGIDMDWVRYRTGYTVALMSGYYRSPDIMGLHAAHVIMFSFLLALRSRSASRYGWAGAVLWGMFCVLLSGRRKMVGIPFVFVATYLFFGTLRKAGGGTRIAQITALVVAVGGTIGLLFWSPEESAEYTDYATTLFTEGAERTNEVIVGSSIGTLQQVGVLGAGLGTATQGRYYLAAGGSSGPRSWQEDGVSRLILEFGVPGVLLLIWGAFMLIGSMQRARTLTPRNSSEQVLQIGLLSVVAGNAASYAISHQQFSGDPVNSLFATMMIGMVLGVPRIVGARLDRARRQREEIVLERPVLQESVASG